MIDTNELHDVIDVGGRTCIVARFGFIVEYVSR